jgi:hypothetical protein
VAIFCEAIMPKVITTIASYARRYGIAALGWFVILFGLVIGPILLVPVGVAILAWEFPWARRMLRRAKARVRYWWRRRRATRAGSESER